MAPVRADVTVYGAGADLSLVNVTAPDTVGLLWAVSDWFAHHGVSIESLDASNVGRVAHDVFLVSGPFDPDALVTHLAHPGFCVRATGRDAALPNRLSRARYRRRSGVGEAAVSARGGQRGRDRAQIELLVELGMIPIEGRRRQASR